MNARDRILTALEHREPDRVPIYEGTIDNMAIAKEFSGKTSIQGLRKAMRAISRIPGWRSLYSGFMKSGFVNIGNVSPQELAMETVDQITTYTRRLIREVAPGGGFILASGHSINPFVKKENYLAMLDIAKRHGTYPIQDVPI